MDDDTRRRGFAAVAPKWAKRRRKRLKREAVEAEQAKLQHEAAQAAQQELARTATHVQAHYRGSMSRRQYETLKATQQSDCSASSLEDAQDTCIDLFDSACSSSFEEPGEASPTMHFFSQMMQSASDMVQSAFDAVRPSSWSPMSAIRPSSLDSELTFQLMPIIMENSDGAARSISISSRRSSSPQPSAQSPSQGPRSPDMNLFRSIASSIRPSRTTKFTAAPATGAIKPLPTSPVGRPEDQSPSFALLESGADGTPDRDMEPRSNDAAERNAEEEEEEEESGRVTRSRAMARRSSMVVYAEAVEASVNELDACLRDVTESASREVAAKAAHSEARQAVWLTRWGRRRARADAKARAIEAANQYMRNVEVEQRLSEASPPANKVLGVSHGFSLSEFERRRLDEQAFASPGELQRLQRVGRGASVRSSLRRRKHQLSPRTVDYAQQGREVYASTLISSFVAERREFMAARERQLAAAAVVANIAMARKAAEGQAAAAKEAAEVADAALATATRYRDIMPAAYFHLDKSIRELLEMAVFISNAREKATVELIDLQAAALALHKGSDASSQSGDDVVETRFAALPRTIREVVKELVSMVMQGKVPIVELASAQPLTIRHVGARSEDVRVFLVAHGLRTGGRLPPHAPPPWRFSEWWEPALTAGTESAGARAFAIGLLACSPEVSRTSLGIRAQIGGHRPTAIHAVSVLFHAVASADLRDNQVNDVELEYLGGGVAGSDTLRRLILAGNPITAAAVCKLFHAMAMAKRQASDAHANSGSTVELSELDLSRCKLGSESFSIGADTESRVDMNVNLGRLGSAMAKNGGVHGSLLLSNVAMGDDEGASFFAELTKPLQTATSLMLTHLDLSGNMLKATFVLAFSKGLPHCTLLRSLSLADNNLGSKAGGDAIEAALKHASLRVLDVSNINLCDSSPLYPCAGAPKWSHDAVRKLATGLLTSSVTDLHLHSNELCGQWTECVCGTLALRGVYTRCALDLVIEVLEAGERLALRREGLHLETGNHLQSGDQARLLNALALNSVKVAKVGTAARKLPLAAPLPAAEGDVACTQADRSEATDAGLPLKWPVPLSELEVCVAELEVLNQGASSLSDPDSSPPAPSPRNQRRSKEVRIIGKPLTESESPPLGDPKGTPLGSPRRSPLLGTKASRATASPPALLNKAKSPLGSTTPRDRGASPGNTSSLRGIAGPSTLSPDESSSSHSAGAVRAKQASHSGYGVVKKKKKKVVEAVKVEETSPFANSPLMLVTVVLYAREAAELDSPVVGKVVQGSLVRVGDTKVLFHKTRTSKMAEEHRMLVELDGDGVAFGWVTGISFNGDENLQLAAMGFPLMVAVRRLPIRKGKEQEAQRVGDLQRDELVRVMETCVAQDGQEKVLVSREGQIAKPVGWVTKSTSVKRTAEEADATDEIGGSESIAPKLELTVTFDLRIHTAQSLIRVLSGKTNEVVRRFKAGAAVLPSQKAEKRPSVKPEDGPEKSRHRLVTQPATIKLAFNCFNAPFKVTKWTGFDKTPSIPFEKLPLEQTFDLICKRAKRKLGRIKLAFDLNTTFLERVEFPDEWLLAEDVGLNNDGWQGESSLELEINWGKEVATVEVQPWLAYSASVGARIMVRKVGAAFGQCATVQRLLGDDRCVARVDGHSRSDGVKGEVMVDLMPSTVVLTTFSHHDRGTKLLILHEGRLVDGTVLRWLGRNEACEGSRHMILVRSVSFPTAVQAWYELNSFNHTLAGGLDSAVFEERRASHCRHLMATESFVEDAITGNKLTIKDQLIFMEACPVPGGCNPPQYESLRNVQQLVKEQLVDSPNRTEGTHTAQPVLCRAGPGTGKTWMIKQTLFLFAQKLSDDETAGSGVRLVPVVIYVQRLVRLLREDGDDPMELLADPRGLARWYVSKEFAGNTGALEMLLIAYELTAWAVLIDGVDEAAGMRDIVEAFVHYELVPSGNRLIVTSRPEGVDLGDYKTRFAVMNLCELSQEQQRTVIQMQLQGNAFFEHLVNISECRKHMDQIYKETFRSDALRTEVEETRFGLAALLASEENAERVTREMTQARDVCDVDGKPAVEDELSYVGLSDEEFEAQLGWAKLRAQAKDNRKTMVDSLSTRRLVLDSPAELQALLMATQKSTQKSIRSAYLRDHNASLAVGSDGAQLLEELETTIRDLPSPCTRAQASVRLNQLDVACNEDTRETLMLLTLQRKLPVKANSGSKRGGKSMPIPAPCLWYQVVQFCEEKFVAIENMQSTFEFVLGVAGACVGIKHLAPKMHEQSGHYLPGSAREVPRTTYRNPVALWIESTYPVGAEAPASELPPWSISATISCETCEQCVELLRRMVDGIQVETESEMIALTPLDVWNSFALATAHPTHRRNALCHMLLTRFNKLQLAEAKATSLSVMIEVEHKVLSSTSASLGYTVHYNFFWERVLITPQRNFDIRFETLLLFLMEAIGVPVLLSMLLLSYANTSKINSNLIDLDDLPDNRLVLYKNGIQKGVHKRLSIETALQMKDSSTAAVEAVDWAEGGRGRVKLKASLQQALDPTHLVEDATPQASATTEKRRGSLLASSNAAKEPVLDLNSILRGKKVRMLVGADDVSEAYSLVVRVLEKSKQPGFDLRSGIVSVVPKSHTMHAPVTALVEYVLIPPQRNEAALQEIATTMLRRVAVDNQENGRREFTSKDMACCLGATPAELGLWTRLDLNHEHGVSLVATLAGQSDKAPAQYQFKHLSFQEGLFAEHLLGLIVSLTPPNGPGWPGWATDQSAADFLNNRYMNNTCRIAAGTLGGLLATQRANWNFCDAPLSESGRSALTFITCSNLSIESINLSQNGISWDDAPGIATMINTCPSLHTLDVSENGLNKLVEMPPHWSKLCESFGNSQALTNLNLNSNHLGPKGVHIVTSQLRNSKNLKRLGFSHNEPGIEPMLVELLRTHPALTSVELVETLDRHLPSRVKDELGHALMDNPAACLGFLHCNTFVLSEQTHTLTWPPSASIADAVLLAGVLRTNSALKTFNIAPNSTLENKGRSEIGLALLHNPNASVAYCNAFGLAPNVETCEFDLAKPELKDVDSFRLLAGCLRGNRTVLHVTLLQLRMELIPSLALALRENNTLQTLKIISTSRSGGQAVVQLDVPELKGTGAAHECVDASGICIEGALNRVACATLGMLISTNTVLECLDLSSTGVGMAISAEGEGGHILFKPLCESAVCSLNEVLLNNASLSDKAGGKLINALSTGLGEEDCGYDKITSLSLASNDLGKQFTTALKQLLWSERAPCVIESLDVSNNALLDGFELTLALRRNDSLTSLDVRGIPGANTDDVYELLGSHLLLDGCTCRLGFFACDAFQIARGQTELFYNRDGRDALQDGTQKPESELGNSVVLMLAGVIKFNLCLLSLTVAFSLSETCASSVATAIRGNKCLESLDLSGASAISKEGVEEIAEAVSTHPRLQSFCLDGAALPVVDLCGGEGANTAVDVTNWSLGERSGFAMGALLACNKVANHVDCSSNDMGASAVERLVRGLGEGEAPLRTLNLSGTGLREANNAKMLRLSTSLCSLGSLGELILDENELSCSDHALAPICKLRQLRILSLERNKLAKVPSLIGTMMSLRRLQLHSNQLTELPESLSLLTALEVLDVHKNTITALHPSIGKLCALQKLDLSENKLRELPMLICELQDDLQLFVGRNPLEKPTIEQARQGITMIRRFFNFTKADVPELTPEPEPTVHLADMLGRMQSCPHRQADEPSRHDWAPPGGEILLFNCHHCPCALAPGVDAASFTEAGALQLIAVFNMQCVGRIHSTSGVASETLFDRLEFFNMWLPWREQVNSPGETPTLLIEVKGRKKAGMVIVTSPRLAFGASIGARFKVRNMFCTVTALCEDDRCEVVRDGAQESERIDLTPHTASRTSSVSYRSGQKLMMLHEGRFIDAVVDTWLGVRCGSRHRVRLVTDDQTVASPTGRYARHSSGGAAASPPTFGRERLRSRRNAFAHSRWVEVDLNELNHAKLLFSTVSKYEATHRAYLESIVTRHATVPDDATEQKLQTIDQRVFLQPYAVAACSLADGDGAIATAVDSHGAQAVQGGRVATSVNALLLIEELLTPAATTAMRPTIIRVQSGNEQDLLAAQLLHSLARSVLALSATHPRRITPVLLSMARLADLAQDETKRAVPREMILQALAMDSSGSTEMLRQAMELRALVIIADVRDDLGFSLFRDQPILDEMLNAHLIVVASMNVSAVASNKALPPPFHERCAAFDVHSLGLHFNDVTLGIIDANSLFLRMMAAATHYTRVFALHLSTCQLGTEAMHSLAKLLTSEACCLRMLDVSFTNADASTIAESLVVNRSLTSLDVRKVHAMQTYYEKIGALLLQPSCRCPLGFLRCDAFELLEGKASISLRERPLDRRAIVLLAGLLTNNDTVQELDLGATGMQKRWSADLISSIDQNTSLRAIHFPYNPLLDVKCQAELLASVEERNSGVVLHF